jgi:hypothetical protein
MNVKYVQFTLIAHDFSKWFFHYINNEVNKPGVKLILPPIVG